MRYKNTALVSTDALRHNYRAVREILREAAGPSGRGPRLICVVKADAYGHGVGIASRVFGDEGCDFFAVSSEAEAVELLTLEEGRGRRPDVLILSHVLPENAGEMAARGVTVAAVSAEDAASLSGAVSAWQRKTGLDTPLSVHVKLDTGMNRVGFPTDDGRLPATLDAIEAISRDPALRLTGVFTHFACADDELLGGKPVNGMPAGSFTENQLRRYRRVLDGLTARGIDPGLRHAANSSAILALPAAAFDAVRAGVILYGLSPDSKPDGRFIPAMRFTSTVLHVHEMKAGESVSYGATFTAPRDMTVATVGAGYADGFERSYSGCFVRIRGRAFRQIGRICMDQFMVDVTPEAGEVCEVRPGDPVLLFGDDEAVSANALAALSGSINYEVICRVSARVVREPV